MKVIKSMMIHAKHAVERCRKESNFQILIYLKLYDISWLQYQIFCDDKFIMLLIGHDECRVAGVTVFTNHPIWCCQPQAGI